MTAQAQLAVLGRYRVMRLVVKSQEVVHPNQLGEIDGCQAITLLAEEARARRAGC
jgi:hypothetical protein